MGSRCVATFTLHEVSQETADKKLIFFCFVEKKLMWRGLKANRNLFKKFDILRPVLQARIIMVTGGTTKQFSFLTFCTKKSTPLELGFQNRETFFDFLL